MSSATLPDMCHVKRQDAEDIAEEIIGLIEQRGRVCLYLDAAGVVGVKCHVLDIPDPCNLVGVYDDNSTKQQIADDILAMQREPIHGGA